MRKNIQQIYWFRRWICHQVHEHTISWNKQKNNYSNALDYTNNRMNTITTFAPYILHTSNLQRVRNKYRTVFTTNYTFGPILLKTRSYKAIQNLKFVLMSFPVNIINFTLGGAQGHWAFVSLNIKTYKSTNLKDQKFALESKFKGKTTNLKSICTTKKMFEINIIKN